MSDETTPTPSTPSSTAPPGSEPTWKAGENAPAWARGKTPEEILGIAQQREQYLTSALQQAAQAAYQQPQAQQTPAQVQDDDYLTGKQFKEVVGQYGQGVNSALIGAYQQTYQVALRSLRSEFRKDFDLWGPEIMSKLESLPLHLRNLDTMETVVKLVRSEHLDDLVKDQAQEMLATGNLTLRSNGSGKGYPGTTQSTNPLESEKLPAETRARLARQNVNMETVREFCRMNGITVEQWLADAEKAGSGVIVDRGKLG